MRRPAAAAIDLGDEPPLGVDGDPGARISRRRVSVRWLMATLLTGICGAGLMGGAVYAALDGEYRFAQMPETVRSALRGALAAGERPSNAARKGDRMSILTESFNAKQTLRLSSNTRVGDREIIKVRAVTKVAANLALAVTSASTDIPRFNPAQLVSDGADKPEEAPQAEPTGELTLVQRDIAQLPPSSKFAAELPMEDVLMKVREVAEFGSPEPAARLPAMPSVGGPLGFAAVGGADDPNGLSLMPDNISSMTKTDADATGGNDWSERAVVAKKGDTIVSVLVGLGVPEVSARAAAATFPGRGPEGALSDGLRLKILLDTSSGGGAVPLRVALFSDSGHEGTVALSDMGKFVQVEEPGDSQVADIAQDEDDDEQGGRGGITLYESLYETALRHDVPREVIGRLVKVYSFDIDFQRRVRPGDSFEVLYDEGEGDGVVLYAGLTVGGEERRYYRYQTPDDGMVDFYDESGKSAKKFLVRKPVAGGVLRSGFGIRRHPILGYTKMHTGVDWADRTGTPIYAAGDGTVVKLGWSSGYGRHTEIQHTNGYLTTYSHQSGFAKSLREGTRVRQGQLIGYIGSTGLSTGPHLHYEVKVNGRFVDPMRIRLPRGRALEGKVLVDFDSERSRIDTLLNHSPAPKVAGNATRLRAADAN